MKFKQGQKIFFLLAACFLLATAFFLFPDGRVAVDPLPDPAPGEISPGVSAPEPPAEKRVILHPRTPAPGNFLVIEAGPLAQGADFDLDFDFPGQVSTLYRTGDQLYAVIGISYEAEPGSYRLKVQKDTTRQDKSGLKATVNIEDKDFQTARFSMPEGITEGWTAERLAEDREKIREALTTTEPYPLWLQSFIPPLEGKVTSEFGAIRIIDDNPPRRHSGIDIGAEEGTPIVAPNRGIVRLADSLLAQGKTVIIDHGMDLSSTYMHMHSIDVEEGQGVDRGDMIGTVGDTGYATGAHLHWEVNIGQTPVNPGQLIENELLWIPPAYVEDKISSER